MDEFSGPQKGHHKAADKKRGQKAANKERSDFKKEKANMPKAAFRDSDPEAARKRNPKVKEDHSWPPMTL